MNPANSLVGRLNNSKLMTNAGFVAGKWQTDSSSGQTFDVTNPSNQNKRDRAFLLPMANGNSVWRNGGSA